MSASARQKKLIIACGGTAGHYLPALSMLKVFQKKNADWRVFAVITRREPENLFTSGGVAVIRLSLVPVTRSISLKNALAILKLCAGIMQSLWQVIRVNPDVVIGFGGYASFFTVFFAALLGKKTVIHEQNARAGISNKFLALFVNRVAVSFEQSREDFSRVHNKVVVTGNPLRPDLSFVARDEALRFFNFSRDRFTALVMGGSQGSRRINFSFVQALARLEPGIDLQVIHLCGKLDYAQLKEAYGKIGVEVRLLDYLKDMKFAYSLADMVISRSGAGAVNEIEFYRLPALLVPYPHAGGHQKENAKILQERGGCIIIEDDRVSAQGLEEHVRDMVRAKDTLRQWRTQLMAPSAALAAESLAETVAHIL